MVLIKKQLMISFIFLQGLWKRLDLKEALSVFTEGQFEQHNALIRRHFTSSVGRGKNILDLNAML